MIRIRKPLCFSEIGRKDNQEDYLYPADAAMNTRVFILCDGMGGHDNGEVASMTAGSTIGEYLTSCSVVDIPTFETGLAKAYDALDSIDTNSSKKPGTTMACLCLNDNNFLVAHIGDSRIYHIRPSLYNHQTKRGGILYQSSDHSLVNDLLKAGELTEEEARKFPQKNIITRAMQPHLDKRHTADVYMFDDIKDGDYFFLCCDGVLEQLSNEVLCEILADKKLDDSKKIAKIKSICDGNTRDNYTCWLIPIDKVTIKGDTNVSPVIQASAETIESAKVISNKVESPSHPSRFKNRSLSKKIPLPKNLMRHFPSISKISSKDLIKWLIGLLVVIALIFTGVIFHNRFVKKKDMTSIEQGSGHLM